MIDHDTKPAAPGQTADEQLDCRGLLCPLPVYQASRAMGRLKPGQVLRVDCTDPGSRSDFPAFARMRGHTLLASEVQGDVHVFYLRKEAERATAARTTRPG